MAVHVAIFRPPYDRLVLDGVKTIESRLTKTPLPPFGVVTPGDRIYMKRSAGPFFAVAEVAKVWLADQLTPEQVDEIRRRFDDRICGNPEYWTDKRAARFATLVWLRDVQPCTLAPRYKTQNMRAWYTLDDDADPMKRGKAATAVNAHPGHDGRRQRNAAAPRPTASAFDVELTAGAIRQNSVRIAPVIDRFPADARGGRTKAERGEPIELRLTGGPTVLTDLVDARRMIRWRGWRDWFAASGARPGDRLRFTPTGARAFDVKLVRSRS